MNLVIDYLTQSGWMTAAQLYETPFTDYSARGVDGIFNPEQVKQLIGIVDQIPRWGGSLITSQSLEFRLPVMRSRQTIGNSRKNSL